MKPTQAQQKLLLAMRRGCRVEMTPSTGVMFLDMPAEKAFGIHPNVLYACSDRGWLLVRGTGPRWEYRITLEGLRALEECYAEGEPIRMEIFRLRAALQVKENRP